jgi:LPS-assembly protein
LRPELTLHETYYTERLVGESGENPGQAENDAINRQALETAVEVRPPALERVFDKEFLGRKWKHVIEPHAAYRFVTGVNNYPNILKFDERDILTDTHEVEYGFVTRLYAKPTSAKPEKPEDCSALMRGLTVGGPAPESTIPWQHTNPLVNPQCQPGPTVREIATWELDQKYFLDPTFGGALIPGQRNVFATTADLTGIAFLTGPRHLSPLVSRLRVETSARTDAEWDMDFDFQNNRVNASTILANYHIGQVTVGGGDAILQIPVQSEISSSAQPAKFNQFRAALGYGRLTKRGFSAATSLGFDAESKLLQFLSAQTTYNWDCCGMTVEYRTYTVANIRTENLFRFTFTLANIGGFGSMRPQERLY